MDELVNLAKGLSIGIPQCQECGIPITLTNCCNRWCNNCLDKHNETCVCRKCGMRKCPWCPTMVCRCVCAMCCFPTATPTTCEICNKPICDNCYPIKCLMCGKHRCHKCTDPCQNRFKEVD